MREHEMRCGVSNAGGGGDGGGDFVSDNGQADQKSVRACVFCVCVFFGGWSGSVGWLVGWFGRNNKWQRKGKKTKEKKNRAWKKAASHTQRTDRD